MLVDPSKRPHLNVNLTAKNVLKKVTALVPNMRSLVPHNTLPLPPCRRPRPLLSFSLSHLLLHTLSPSLSHTRTLSLTLSVETVCGVCLHCHSECLSFFLSSLDSAISTILHQSIQSTWPNCKKKSIPCNIFLSLNHW